ncbi:hypothetical protein L202_07122 [Cryptococcus amylolentus CBS 6039]|uniref:Uncharacterized protein n=1 Tax=Cryptococcus amylolentus CBS 6039 TaxID=1295533 RepID=A0A1E3HEN8_9TREE|nr:hypothetical protein L202_07122 [Cryptococcus amylolentus CBS 6039]ODN74807.1 hypothetical protein L202_07122 [Cryptococcus amylolentus CBS 6039]
MVIPHIPSFGRKGDRDKDKDVPPPSSSDHISPTSTKRPNHQSTGSTSSTVDSSASKYHPIRLLRRKASVSAPKDAPPPTFAGDFDPPVSASSSGSVLESQQTVPPLSSTVGVEDREGSDHEGFKLFPRRKSESKPRRKSRAERPGSASKRAAWVYDRQLHGGDAIEDVPGRPSSPSSGSGGNGDADGDVFGGMGGPASALGLGEGSSQEKYDINARLTTERDYVAGSSRHRRSLTPPDSAPPLHHPFLAPYPTPLSPPRRPGGAIPSSPRALQSFHAEQKKGGRPSTAPSSINETLASPASRPVTPTTVSSPLRKAHPPSASPAPPSSPSPIKSSTSPRPLSQPAQPPRTPVVTAEWLKRKPSSGRLRHTPSLSADNIPLPPNPLAYGTPPRPAKNGSRAKGLDESPRIHMSTARERNVSSSSTSSSSTDAFSSDGEIGFKSPTRRNISTPTRPPSASRAIPLDGSYEVQINCSDDREEMEEMKWEVTIRRRSSRNPSQQPVSPLHLDTTSSTTTAPLTASSINLSLSLDEPTGKLVFISFPMDIHATPTRRRRGSQGGHAGSREKEKVQAQVQQYQASPRNSFGLAPRPVTPPSSNRAGPVTSESEVEEVERLKAETPRPATPTSARRKAPPPWPDSMAQGD